MRWRNRNEPQAPEQDEPRVLTIGAHELPAIVFGILTNAPSEDMARALGGEVLDALAAVKEHWETMPPPAPELEQIWDLPAWGEEGWQA